MKKILLFACFLCNIMSYAQLTSTCPCAINTAVFNLITPATSTNPAYYMAQPGPKFHLNRYLDNSDGQNKWTIVYESPGGFIAQYYKSSPNNSLQPPCNEVWEVVGSNPKTYISINFTGNTCITIPSGGSPVVPPLGPTTPGYTSNQLAALPNPPCGLTLYDFSLRKFRFWDCLAMAWMPQ